MLIEICEDVIDEVERGNEDAISTLEKIGLAYKYGKHIVSLQINLYDRIKNCCYVSEYIKDLFKQIIAKYYSIGLIKKSVTFSVKVTFGIDTQRQDTGGIIINPRNNNSFEFYEETHFLVENLLDEKFYKYCLEYYKRNNNIQIGYSYYTLLGGGSTITNVYQLEIDLKQHFCLAIVDSDKNCPYNGMGDTAKFLLKADKKKPFNCMCYNMKHVMEIENLLPKSVVRKLTSEVDNLQFDLSFFDYKKGICKEKLINPNLLKYWKQELIKSIYYNELLRIENDVKALDAEKFKEKYKNEKLIEGFGGNVLSSCLNNYEDDLAKIKVKGDLTDAQAKEWTEIGKLFFEWTIAPSNLKRT